MKLQHTLEKQFNIKQLIFLTLNDTLADVFGPIENWTISVGDVQLLLEPNSGTWMFFDFPHDTVETTGFRAGEVIFYLEHGELALRPNPEPTIWTQDRRFELAEDLHVRYARWSASGLIDQESYLERINWLQLKDRRGNLWKLSETGHMWLTWIGSIWVEGHPPREYAPSEESAIWLRFFKVKEMFFQLWSQANNGMLTQQEYINAVNQLRLQDDRGGWWQVRESDGAWLRWSGKDWVEQQPLII